MAWLIHSQKGSEWKDHQYIKREGTSGKYEDDGKYYYPDSYEGGRHLPKGDSQRSSKKGSSDSGDKQEDWEKKVHGHLSKIIEDHPDLFKNGTDVAAGIMDPKNFDAVKNTLKAFGVNVDKMSDDEIKAYRKKIADYYDKNYSMDEGKTSSKSSKKKEKKEMTDEEKKPEEKKEESDSKSSKKKEEKPYQKPYMSRAVYYGGKASPVQHSAWMVHSAKGTEWKKHKYIKKIGNRYYYKDDLERQKSIYNNTRKLNEAVARVQNKQENAYYDIESHRKYGPDAIPYDIIDVASNHKHRNNYKVHQQNIKKLEEGKWDKYALRDADVKQAVKAQSNLRALKDAQKEANTNRPLAAKVEMFTATTVDKGKSFLNNLFKKKK